MKQTAVEFLQEALYIHFTHEQEMQFIGLFNQALEMEKQQIIDATRLGEYVNDNGETAYVYVNKEIAERYYNENYSL
jgi:hypothetical protein